jgi:hypothetical protein
MADIQQLDTRNPDGCRIGAATTDKVGFYGVTPAAQQAVGAAVATTNLGTTGILAGLNALNTLSAALKTIGIVKT